MYLNNNLKNAFNYYNFINLQLQRRNVIKVQNFDQMCLSMDDLTFQSHFRLTRETYKVILIKITYLFSQ